MTISEDIRRIEAKALHICMTVTNGDICKAAGIYGVSSEQMQKLVRKHNFDIQSYRTGNEQIEKWKMGLRKGTPLRSYCLDHVYKTLKECNWNQTHTAVVLGISTRSLFEYCKELRSLGYDVKHNPMETRRMSNA